MTIIGQEKPSLDEVLEHHGVKGQRWGVRRNPHTGVRPIARSLNDSRFGQKSIARADKHGAKVQAKIDAKVAKPKKLSRQEVEAQRQAFYQKKADNILKTASEDHESLIALKTQQGRFIVTGEQFINHMTAGGLMDIRASDVYATRETGANGEHVGPYILNPNANQAFVPSDTRK